MHCIDGIGQTKYLLLYLDAATTNEQQNRQARVSKPPRCQPKPKKTDLTMRMLKYDDVIMT